VQRTAEQFQVVPVDQHSPGDHEREQLPAAVDQAEHHRRGDRHHGRGNEQGGADAGAERPAVQFVQRVRADADRQEERDQRADQPPQH